MKVRTLTITIEASDEKGPDIDANVVLDLPAAVARRLIKEGKAERVEEPKGKKDADAR